MKRLLLEEEDSNLPKKVFSVFDSSVGMSADRKKTQLSSTSNVCIQNRVFEPVLKVQCICFQRDTVTKYKKHGGLKIKEKFYLSSEGRILIGVNSLSGENRFLKSNLCLWLSK